MSRVGRKVIVVPAGVKVSVTGAAVDVSSPLPPDLATALTAARS